MDFNFPKLPNIPAQQDQGKVEEGKPETEATGKFLLPTVEQGKPEGESPLQSGSEGEKFTRLQEEFLRSSRFQSELRPQERGAPRLNKDKDLSSTETEQFEKTDEFPIEEESPTLETAADPEIEAGAAIVEEPLIEAPTETAEQPTKELSHVEKQFKSTEPEQAPYAQRTAETERPNIAEIVASTTSRFYSIGVGQSLEQVAQEAGIDVFDLLRANPQLLKDPLIFAGQRVKVPAQSSQETINQNRSTGANAALETAQEQPRATTLKESHAPSPDLESLKENISVARPGQQSIGSKSSENTESLQKSGASQDDSEVQRTKRGTEPDSTTENRKQTTPRQNETAVPNFGVHGNREKVDELIVEERQQRSDRSIPEPFDEWADYIYSAANEYNLEPSLLASVIWHESAGKNIIGKDGHGHGLMQIDKRRYSDWLETHDNGLDPKSNIAFGASIIRKNIDHFRGKLAAGIAAYDCGIDAVEEALVLGNPVDYFTRNGNYSLSVLTEQEHFRRFF